MDLMTYVARTDASYDSFAFDFGNSHWLPGLTVENQRREKSDASGWRPGTYSNMQVVYVLGVLLLLSVNTCNMCDSNKWVAEVVQR